MTCLRRGMVALTIAVKDSDANTLGIKNDSQVFCLHGNVEDFISFDQPVINYIN